MRILVTGGTGFVGRHLCRELADRDHDVTALARNPDDAELPDPVDTVAGDVADYDAIAPAFDGMDAVVNLVALSPLYKPSGSATHDDVHRQGTENCLRAAAEHDVTRFLQMSALGADPDGSTAYLRAKGRAEAAVRDSNLDWTIVRPSVIFGDGGEFVEFTKRLKRIFAPGVPIYPLPGGGRTRFQPIHVEDLAPIMAEVLEDERHVGETYEFAGPEVLTLADVARLSFRAEGRRIRIVPLPMALAKVGLTVMGPLPFLPFGPDQARSLELDNTVSDNDVSVVSRDPASLTTLASYLGLEEA